MDLSPINTGPSFAATVRVAGDSFVIEAKLEQDRGVQVGGHRAISESVVAEFLCLITICDVQDKTFESIHQHVTRSR